MSNTDIIKRLQSARFTVTLSASHKHTDTAFDDAQTHHLHKDIKALGLRHEHAHGYYESGWEQSFVVYCDDMFDVLRLLPLRGKYNQNCILVTDNHANLAMLHWANETTQIGHGWEEISLNDTHALTAYTCIDGKYFVIK